MTWEFFSLSVTSLEDGISLLLERAYHPHANVSALKLT